MAMEKGHSHRSGALKQTNKTHKHGKHRSKGSIAVAAKGKVSLKALSRKNRTELNREQRRNQSVQLRKNKRELMLNEKRSKGLDNAPLLICILPLHKHIDSNTVMTIISQCDPDSTVHKSLSGVTHISVPRFKQRYAFVQPSIDNEFAILDALKVSDMVLFVISAACGVNFGAELIDEFGNKILQTVFAQGLPTPIVAVSDLESIAPKKRNEQRQNIQKLVEKWLPDDKIVPVDNNSDGINLLRKIANQKRKSVIYRDRRPHLYGERVEYQPDNEGGLGTLKVSGYVRGAPLSVNKLIYIPGLGNFQMSQIDTAQNRNEDNKEGCTMKILEKADPNKQESLQTENIPDPLDAEQTWPTEEEMRLAEEENKARMIKRVPKGWSDYQAAWIPDDDAEYGVPDVTTHSDDSSDDSDGEEDFEDAMSEEASSGDGEDGGEDMEAMTESSEIGVNDQQYDQQTDLREERDELEKVKAAKCDQQFPDEVDTPHETTARVRFQKYRGLESFRTSPWDTKENLPSDFARIFQFANFDRTKRRVIKEQKDLLEGAMPGWYVTIHVKDVSQLLWDTFKTTNSPVVLMGLFPHENKMSVLNVVLRRTANYDQPIKSKERLIFQCGYRRFIVNPVFSQHTNGKKHKFERYFQADSSAVATFYGPIQFPPAPVLCYKEVNDKLVLVATGTLLSCNPDRIILKRTVLSGHPLKLNKRSAVIRFMFFNREDIMYFKPCKLRTKHGRIGHIKEPLGTHGHMKCTFDGQLQSQDTVLLNLFKRVFPKWVYEECIVSCVNSVGGNDTTTMDL